MAAAMTTLATRARDFIDLPPLIVDLLVWVFISPHLAGLIKYGPPEDRLENFG